MNLHLGVCTALALLGLGLPLGAAPTPEPKPPTAEDMAQARKVVEASDKLQGQDAIIEPINDPEVLRSLPGCVLIGVRFRQFPVARRVPPGLSGSNLFAVDRSDKITVLSGPHQLDGLFRTYLVPATNNDRLKDAAVALVRLAAQLHQDGFFRFQLLPDATKVGSDAQGPTASATMGVIKGGSGFLQVTLCFDKTGRMIGRMEKNALTKGPRPICQATKLLDPDPVVRRMAEQDLLIMGKAAKPYLDEQRSRASAPLQQAIDHLWRRIEQSDRDP